MADDPRIAPMVSRWGDAAKALLPPEWSPEWFIAELLAAGDAADPLRALLADEDRAVEFAARARYAYSTEGWPVADSWADLDQGVRAAWLESVQDLRAVLAALREVAGGG